MCFVCVLYIFYKVLRTLLPLRTQAPLPSTLWGLHQSVYWTNWGETCFYYTKRFERRSRVGLQYAKKNRENARIHVLAVSREMFEREEHKIPRNHVCFDLFLINPRFIFYLVKNGTSYFDYLVMAMSKTTSGLIAPDPP